RHMFQRDEIGKTKTTKLCHRRGENKTMKTQENDLVRHWRFPMGDKEVDIYISGDGELSEADDECFREFLDASWRTFNVQLAADDPRNPTLGD
ncbi:MAG: hypothetical protein AAGH89_09460, partial [Verrucomicrobiota bacterium]